MPGPGRPGSGLASRRQLLGATAVGLGAVGVAGRASAAGQKPPGLTPDAQVLGQLLQVERKLVATYRSVLSSDVLNVLVAGRVSGMLDQERQHMGALQVEIGRLGAPQTLALPTPVLAPATTGEALSLLLTAETAAESAYAHAVAALQSPRLVGVAAEIMASEAQHWTVISTLLEPGDLTRAVPSAFVGD